MKSVPGSGVCIVRPGSSSLQLQPMAYSMENPQYPLNDPSVWNDGLVSSSGRVVSPRKALHLPAVYQAVTRIACDVARCPLELYEETGGAFKPLIDDPLYRLTAIQPNREMDAFKFWTRIMTQRLVWQNAYIFIALNAKGEPAELLPLLSDRTRPRRAGGVLYYATEVNGQPVDIAGSRVIHLEGITFDNLEALELVKLMRDAWGLALAQMNFAAKVYRSGGRRGGVLEIPAGMPKPGADKLEEGFRKKYDDEGAWFSTVIIRENAKFHEAQMTLRDSQSIEGREESVRDVARSFNIRPGHLGVETSGVYGNKSDDTRDYLDMTLRPHMKGIDMQCRVKLLPLERQGRQCFEHNTDDLLQMSVKEQFDAYGSGVASMIITPNEARGKLGLAPHPDGDKLQSPNTVSKAATAGVDGKGTKPAVKKTDNAGVELDDNGDPLNMAHQKLLDSTVAGVVAVIGAKAERAAATGAKFITWLDEKLPAERFALARAIRPIAACMAVAGDRDPKRLTDELVIDCYEPLRTDLNAIAEQKTEAELKPAITEYFKNWREQSCDDQQQRAA